MRTLLVLSVVVALLVVAAVVSDRLVREGIEAAATELVEARLREVTDDDAPFSVDVRLEGSALRGLLAGRFAEVHVSARDGVADSVPVSGVQVRALGVSRDARSVESLDMTIRADAAAAIASQVDPAVAEAVLASAVALPPDRIGVQVPVETPVGVLPADVEVLVRVSDGVLVVEPARAVVAGVEVDLAQVEVLRGFALDDELRNGVTVTAAEVVGEGGRPVVVVRLGCDLGCSLR